MAMLLLAVVRGELRCYVSTSKFYGTDTLSFCNASPLLNAKFHKAGHKHVRSGKTDAVQTASSNICNLLYIYLPGNGGQR
jgi:hypothetical protein